MNRSLLIFLLLSPVISVSQSTKLLASLDTTYVPNNEYLKEYTVDSFFESGIGDVQIDYDQIDTALFNASLFLTINRERRSRGKEELIYEPYLDFLAYNCVKYYNRSKFRPSKKNDRLYEKNLYLAARNKSIKCHLFSVNTGMTTVLKLEPKREYHRDLDNYKSPYRLYYRNAKEIKDFPEDEVESMTYNEFAEKALKELRAKAQKKRLHSKSYEIMACFVVIDPKTMYKNRLPVAKVIQIQGARRLLKE